MEAAKDLQNIFNFIKSDAIRILYFSRPSCGVCIAVRPKVDEILLEYPKAEALYVDLDGIPEAAGHYSVFSLPGFLLFVNQKETARFARYFSMAEIEESISRYYNLLYN